MPLCHWSSQLFDLRAPSSTDVPVLLLNQPNKPIKSLYFRSFVVSVLFARFYFKVIRESLYPVEYERQRYRTETSRSHTLIILPKQFAEKVWNKSQSSFLNIYLRLSRFQSIPVHTAPGTEHQSVAQNLSDIEINAGQLSSVRVDFHSRIIFTCLYTDANFNHINKIEPRYKVLSLKVKLIEIQLLSLRATFHALPLYYLRM